MLKKIKDILNKVFTLEDDVGYFNFRSMFRYTLFLSIIFFIIFFLAFLFFLEPRKSYRLINFANMDVLTAIKWLDERNLKVAVFRSNDAVVKKYFITSQRPEPGMEVKSGRKVTLVVSDGPNNVTMPQLVGKTFRVARKTLFASFSGSTVIPEVLKVEEFSDNVASGAVSRHTPAANEKVDLNREIILFVSKGPTQGEFVVENYYLKNYNEVYTELTERGINIDVRYYPAERSADVGKIFLQSVDVGKVLNEGDYIYFDVAIKRDEISEDMANKEIETLRVASFLLPVAKKNIDSFLKVGGIINDARGETATHVVSFKASSTIFFPYKTLGKGSIKFYVEGDLVKEVSF